MLGHAATKLRPTLPVLLLWACTGQPPTGRQQPLSLPATADAGPPAPLVLSVTSDTALLPGATATLTATVTAPLMQVKDVRIGFVQPDGVKILEGKKGIKVSLEPGSSATHSTKIVVPPDFFRRKVKVFADGHLPDLNEGARAQQTLVLNPDGLPYATNRLCATCSYMLYADLEFWADASLKPGTEVTLTLKVTKLRWPDTQAEIGLLLPPGATIVAGAFPSGPVTAASPTDALVFTSTVRLPASMVGGTISAEVRVTSPRDPGAPYRLDLEVTP